MGDAENMILPGIDRESAQCERDRVRNHRIAIDQLYALVPRVVANLRECGYPELEAHPDTGRTIVLLNGERRIGWQVYRDWGGEGFTYILSDGTFVGKGYMQNHVVVVDFHDCHPSSDGAEQIPRIITNLQFLANYKKPEDEVQPLPVITTPSQATAPKRKSRWRRFMAWLNYE